jgi:hypothetical protein
MYTPEAYHNITPKVTNPASVPAIIEMFQGAQGIGLLERVGTSLDPIMQTVSFEYVIDAITSNPKRLAKKRKVEQEATYKHIHDSAFVFAKAVYAHHKEPSRKQLKDFAKGVRRFGNAHWGASRATTKRSPQSTPFSIVLWLQNIAKDCQGTAPSALTELNDAANLRLTALI